MTLIEEVKHVIDLEGLDKKSRYRDHLYRRYFIMWYLRENRMTTIDIGKLFNRDHSTVVCALKRHSELTHPKFGDKLYKATIEDLYQRFNNKTFEFEATSNIYEDIRKAKCLADYQFIQKRLQMGHYGDQNVCTFVGDRAADTSETDQEVRE
jgi:hypothetical protein